ncbi:hypothetical protein X965_11235 [Morganella sp. EGD-HP17]|nr:hypothetical protein X965_11235 [Morganella sp. EGD-HP17]
MLEKYRSIVCWANLWLSMFLIGSARVYSFIHEVTFIEISGGAIKIITCPDPTVAVMVAMGVVLFLMSNFYLLFHYIHVFLIIMTRKAIRI